jgi:chemotaxis protein methyltransferase WspC
MNYVERVLSRVMGLSAQSIGRDAIHDAVRARMQDRGEANFEEYCLALEKEPGELLRLVDEVVVPETWFFRESGSYQCLSDYVARERLRFGPHRPLRVLSLPCATGEEPYSIAITLLASGLPASSFMVDGIDFSPRVLELARRGVYGKNSFRGAPDTYDGYFTANGSGLEPIAAVKSIVRFAHGNLLDPTLFRDTRFDVIFCRNLLIYFERAARELALANIARLLHPNGIVFGGHAESLEFMGAGFRRVGEARCFAFHHPAAVSRAPEAPAVAKRGPAARRAPEPLARAPGLRRGVVGAAKAGAVVEPAPVEPPNVQRLTPEHLLEMARTLADKGDLSSAGKLCEKHLATCGTSAGAYCLLGIVRKAAGDSAGALECLNRALYLDPAHYDALIHLALIHEQFGNPDAARQLRRRAERSEKRGAVR